MKEINKLTKGKVEIEAYLKKERRYFSKKKKKKKMGGGFFCFLGSWGCPTTQENSLKPPQDQ